MVKISKRQFSQLETLVAKVGRNADDIEWCFDPEGEEPEEFAGINKSLSQLETLIKKIKEENA